MDVSFVVVTHQSADYVAPCLASVRSAAGSLACETVVVDNASTDGTQELIRERFPEMRLVVNDQNLGFAAANNLAFRFCRGRYVFLLNPDAELLGDALAELVRFLDEHPEASAAGPTLRNPDRTRQWSVANFPDLPNALFECFFLHKLLPGASNTWGEIVYDERAYSRPRPVDWVMGAAVLFRRDVLDDVGGLDEDFFLFGEELDWFKRLHNAGRQTWFVPAAEVLHSERPRPENPLLFAQNMYARQKYWEKHSGRIRALAARGLALVRVGLRYGLWTAIAVRQSEVARGQKEACRRGLRALWRDEPALGRGVLT